MKHADLTARVVHGLSVRTSHATAKDDIGPLWAKVGASGMLEGHAEAVAVYHDYEVRPDGYECTVTVGFEAEPGADTPETMARVEVPAQRCALWETDGSVEQVVAAWQDVWTQWPDGGPRSFGADVEIWEQGPDGKPKRAQVYVGVRS